MLFQQKKIAIFDQNFGSVPLKPKRVPDIISSEMILGQHHLFVFEWPEFCILCLTRLIHYFYSSKTTCDHQKQILILRSSTHQKTCRPIYKIDKKKSLPKA